MYKEKTVLKWWPCFSTDQINVGNLSRGSPNEFLCPITFKSA